MPEVFGPWSDESVPATTTATNEDDVASAKEAGGTARGGEGDAKGTEGREAKGTQIETVDEVGSNVALEVSVGVAEREEEEEEEETAAEGEFV